MTKHGPCLGDGFRNAFVEHEGPTKPFGLGLKPGFLDKGRKHLVRDSSFHHAKPGHALASCRTFLVDRNQWPVSSKKCVTTRNCAASVHGMPVNPVFPGRGVPFATPAISRWRTAALLVQFAPPHFNCARCRMCLNPGPLTTKKSAPHIRTGACGSR